MEPNPYRKPLEYLLGSFSFIYNSKIPKILYLGPIWAQVGAPLPYWPIALLAMTFWNHGLRPLPKFQYTTCRHFTWDALQRARPSWVFHPHRWGDNLSAPIAPTWGNRALLAKEGPQWGGPLGPKIQRQSEFL